MKITHLKLKDWGPHKELDVDMSSGIVGVVGGNGKGKSKLLKAIGFALTKDLDGHKKETYIRNYGAEGGANKASVELWWIKNGKEGRIIRTITPSGIKGQLQWDGEVLTKDAEITDKMEEIMGVDKSALNNAIFTKQGCIADLITGTPGERTGIFFKLLNLGFLNPRAEDLTRKIDTLKEGITDWGPALEGVRETIKQYETQITALQAEINSVDDPKPVIDFLAQLSNLINKLDMLDRMADNYTGAIRDAIARRNAIIGLSGHADVDKLAEAIEQLSKFIELRQADLDSYDRELEEHNAWRNLTASLKEDTAQLKAVQDQLREYQPSTTLKELVDKLKEDASKAELVEGSAKYKASAEARYKDSQDALLKAEEADKSEAVTSIRQLIKACKEQMQLNIHVVTGAEKILAMYEADGTLKYADGRCPTCGQLVNTITPDELTRMRATVEEAKDKVTQYSNLINAKTKELDETIEAPLRAAAAECDIAKRVFEEAERQYNLLADGHQGLSASILSSQLRTAQRDYREVLDLESRQQRIEARIATTKARLERFGDTEPPCPDLLDLTEEAREQEKRRNELSKLSEWHNSIIRFDSEIASKQKGLDELVDSRDKLVTDIDAFADKAPDQLKDQIEQICNDETYRNSVTDQFVEDYAQLKAKKAQLEGLRAVHKTNKESEERYIEKMSKNAVKLDLIRELQEARSCILKTGMPTLYMEDIFKRLSSSINVLLEQMQANFTVYPDPDTPLTFRFIRIDDPSGYEMPQDSLSGGQAIRLALALLISVQKLILPDVGLLVLDEPSSHIDAEGVHSMSSMFRQLGQVWANSETQLIVVDHNPSLISSFDNVIKLGDAVEG